MNKGFTLIELMIVVAIVGILSMIAVPPYQNFVAKTRFVEILNQLQDQKVRLVNEYVTQGECKDENVVINPQESPSQYISSIKLMGKSWHEDDPKGSKVTVGGKKYYAVCTIVIDMSEKGQAYFKRGNKKATTFYLNLANAEGSLVWGCAASTNFSRFVTPPDCQIPAW